MANDGKRRRSRDGRAMNCGSTGGAGADWSLISAILVVKLPTRALDQKAHQQPEPLASDLILTFS